MKKLLSLILCLSLLLSYGVMAVSAQEEKLIATVASDLHLDQDSFATTLPKRNNVSEAYSHVASSGHLYSESNAILTAFFQQVAESDSNVLLVPGDLGDTGLETEHKALAEMFRKLEKETGKQVYVVPGNHDVTKNPASKFAEIFAEFGYDEAIAKDTNSASYVADLPDGYRLIAIDSTGYKKGGACIDKTRFEWIRQQAEQAQKDGKKTIAMLHHNILPHLVMVELVHSSALVDKSLNMKDMFAQYGVKYIFTGHSHENDIASYTSANGEVIYDVETSSMCLYPCAYREVDFGDSVVFKEKRVEAIDTSLVPAGMSEEAFNLMATDFTEYTRICAQMGVEVRINEVLTQPAFFKNLLKINAEDNPEMTALIDKIIPRLNAAVNMPLYAKDETAEGESIESILKAYDVTIPDSKYDSLLNLAVSLYQDHVAGSENKPPYTNEVVLTSKGIGAALAYTLKDVTAEEYAMVLGYVCELLGVDVPADLINFAGDHIKRFEGIELVVSTAVLPLILKFTVDESPADLNVTLPGYAELIEAPEAEKTFFEKVKDFFNKIITVILSVFAFMR